MKIARTLGFIEKSATLGGVNFNRSRSKTPAQATKSWCFLNKRIKKYVTKNIMTVMFILIFSRESNVF